MAGSDAQREAALLATYDGPEPERVRRAIVFLAQDDPDALAGLVQAARTDYRDVLAWEQQRRFGVTPDPVDVDRLVAWLETESGPPSGAPSRRFEVVLLDAGDHSAEMLKALRSATGLGLAEVSRMSDHTPIAIRSDLNEADAHRLSRELETLGARTDVRPRS